MIKIGGLQKLTLLDYPGKIAATIFLAGCNFRCGFCHNPDLVDLSKTKNFISEQEVWNFLAKRKGLLEAVCVSGGEPLLWPELQDFLRQIKSYGYLIKLDTNGYLPDLLEELIEQKLVDYLAMDIKSSLDQYSTITNVPIKKANILKSIKLIMGSALPYEFRTTILPKYHNLEEIKKIGKMIKGAEQYFLQNFRNIKTFDPVLAQEVPFTQSALEQLQKEALKYVKKCGIRS